MKYRKKHVVIDAYQTDKKVIVETLAGPVYAVPGDYIITGVSGEKYPCKPDIFKKTYELAEGRKDGMDFGEAIKAMKCGKSVTRRGWNGKGMFIYYVPEGRYEPCTRIAEKFVGDDGKVAYRAYIAMKTAQGDVVPWSIAMSDVIENDWEVVDI